MKLSARDKGTQQNFSFFEQFSALVLLVDLHFMFSEKVCHLFWPSSFDRKGLIKLPLSVFRQISRSVNMSLSIMYVYVLLGRNYCYHFKTSYDIETSLLICYANQWASFYISEELKT